MIKIESNHKEECLKQGLPKEVADIIFEPWDDGECVPEDYMPVYIVEDITELNTGEILPDMSKTEKPGMDFCELVGDYWLFGICNTNDGGPTFVLKKELVTPSIQWHFDHWSDWAK